MENPIPPCCKSFGILWVANRSQRGWLFYSRGHGVGLSIVFPFCLFPACLILSNLVSTFDQVDLGYNERCSRYTSMTGLPGLTGRELLIAPCVPFDPARCVLKESGVQLEARARLARLGREATLGLQESTTKLRVNMRGRAVTSPTRLVRT